jgi:hypothetical protein|tara:strand:+ start:277 stop:528 length:252 start_codon:yes stop_codon:yes gene_type:complete
MKKNRKAQKLIEKYFKINNEHPDDENFDCNYYDILGYQETLDESPVEDAFEFEEITHLQMRVEFLQMYHESKRQLENFGHVYS